MLVRLSRAPVLSGGLRRKTQLFSCTLYMAASSKTPPHQSKGPQKFKTPLQVPVFPGSSPLCHYTNSESPSDTTSFHSVLKKFKLGQCALSNVSLWSGREKKKREIGMARKRAENREGSLGFPGEQFFDERGTLRNEAKENILRLQDENKKQYNKYRKPTYNYKPGDTVAIQRTQFGTGLKLRPKYFGPYEVTKVSKHDRYEVQKIGQHEGPNVTSTSADKMKKWCTH
ncbi:transposon Tf2-9 polyprotein [Trichonephila clavipes]|nr:transposon Tf2-9 polyprotein [Trichonephila clavipes]